MKVKRHLFLQLKMSQETRLVWLLKLSLQNLQLSRLVSLLMSNQSQIRLKILLLLTARENWKKKTARPISQETSSLHQLLEKYTISLKLIVNFPVPIPILMYLRFLKKMKIIQDKRKSLKNLIRNHQNQM